MDIKNFETVLSDQNVREKVSNYATLFNQQLQKFVEKEMADFSVDYQTAVNRYFLFKVAEDAYRKHIEAVASDYYTEQN